MVFIFIMSVLFEEVVEIIRGDFLSRVAILIDKSVLTQNMVPSLNHVSKRDLLFRARESSISKLELFFSGVQVEVHYHIFL